MLGRIGFAPVHWKVGRGLSGPTRSTPEAQKLGGAADRRAWEAFAYWHLRHLGHIFIARNYMPPKANSTSSASTEIPSRLSN